MLDVIGVPRDAPVAKLLHAGKITENNLRKLLGNTMSIPCVGTALLYVVCSARPRSEDSLFSQLASANRCESRGREGGYGGREGG